ncbi:hypothetical protein BDZ85DRAFT_38578 [Elsinoe ampelina]|uniref:Uncharacterized protein n=1 Tax=Elsinoe ampelina TaxID=302913 RepID=A0A6A6G262_9PEZI|nr:hypothetical protein BDZ85DRAFT_38578 [Elsinoe ampelina]
MMTDMSVAFDEPKTTDQIEALQGKKKTDAIKVKEDYEDVRDSLYLLGVMNQYTINRIKPRGASSDEQVTRRAEAFLRIVLFSSDLELSSNHHGCKDHPWKLAEARQKTADKLRRTRKRAIVPVFVSMLWFVIALAFSIYSAFNEIGSNATAHDLALGLLLGWLPVLILCTVVDRNPTDPEGNLNELNKLVKSVARSFLDDRTFYAYMWLVLSKYDYGSARVEHKDVWRELHQIRRLCTALAERPSADSNSQSERRVPAIDVDASNARDPAADSPTAAEPAATQSPMTTTESSDPESGQLSHDGTTTEEQRVFDFFGAYAGQGRERWHYGVAHPILSTMEEAWVGSQEGKPPGVRNWLIDEDVARVNIVLGNTRNRHGFIWWDYRELWQISAAFLIVCLSCFSAFVLSYNTPTVGLGCRSGGYMIFVIISCLLLIVELVAWRFEKRPDTVRERKASVISAMRQQQVDTNHPREGTHTTEQTTELVDMPDSHGHSSTEPESGSIADLRLSREMIQYLISIDRLADNSIAQAPVVPRNDSVAESSETSSSDTIAHPEESQTSTHPVPEGTRRRSTLASLFQGANNANIKPTKTGLDPDIFVQYYPFDDRDWIRLFVLIPLECCNAAWLAYIVFAQISGGYRTCECVTSSWELGEGGYLDFNQHLKTNIPSLPYYWGPSTAVGTAVIAIGMIYVVMEWALQSHMNTTDKDAARRGLRRARGWRRLTLPFRRLRENTLRFLKVKVARPMLMKFGKKDVLKPKATMRWSVKGEFELASRSTMDIITQRDKRLPIGSVLRRGSRPR